MTTMAVMSIIFINVEEVDKQAENQGNQQNPRLEKEIHIFPSHTEDTTVFHVLQCS